jgi:transposase-like protein
LRWCQRRRQLEAVSVVCTSVVRTVDPRVHLYLIESGKTGRSSCCDNASNSAQAISGACLVSVLCVRMDFDIVGGDDVWMVELDLSGELGVGPRRRRSAAERRRVVEETLEAGASVAKAALKYGVNANQIFQWRRLYRDSKLGASSQGPMKLLPASVVDDSEFAKSEHVEAVPPIRARFISSCRERSGSTSKGSSTRSTSRTLPRLQAKRSDASPPSTPSKPRSGQHAADQESHPASSRKTSARQHERLA